MAPVHVAESLRRRHSAAPQPSAEGAPSAGRPKRVLIVGGGVTGLVHADVLQRCGFSAVVYERSSNVGGIWSASYADAALQNSYHQYHFPDFPWPFKPDLHATAPQIVRYLEEAVKALDLDVRCGHEVRSIAPEGAGWRVAIASGGAPSPTEAPAESSEYFDHVVVCSGHFGNEHKLLPALPGAEHFGGAIITERDILTDPAAKLAGKRVVVVGFGKAAVDMVSTAVDCGAVGQVHHLFRAARWMIPIYFLRILHATYAMLPRASTALIPCWTQPSAVERFLHQRCAGALAAVWGALGWVVRTSHRMAAAAHCGAVPAAHAAAAAAAGVAPPPPPAAKDPAAAAAAAAALDLVLSPAEPLRAALRSATLLPPDSYCGWVRAGYICPRRGEVARYLPGAVELKDGSIIEADVVIWGVGSVSATFPFLPPDVRSELEGGPDGAQLYRHVLLPGHASLAMGGFNASFMTTACAAVGALWLAAVWQGHLRLPPAEEQAAVAARVGAWKRRNLMFTTCRLSTLAARSQQYLDVMLQDLGLSPYRKMPNLLAELFMRYGAADYAGLVDEFYEAVAARRRRGQPALTAVALDM